MQCDQIGPFLPLVDVSVVRFGPNRLIFIFTLFGQNLRPNKVTELVAKTHLDLFLLKLGDFLVKHPVTPVKPFS